MNFDDMRAASEWEMDEYAFPEPILIWSIHESLGSWYQMQIEKYGRWMVNMVDAEFSDFQLSNSENKWFNFHDK